MASNKLYLERDLLKSEVFRSLGRTGMIVYFDFRMKCKVQPLKRKRGRQTAWTIINNGELEYTYSEAEKKGISRSRFMRALDELIEKGLIDITHSGAGGVKGDKSTYRISERWREWGSDRFVPKARSRDIRGGRGFAAYWKKRRKNIGIRNDNPAVIDNDNPQSLLKLMDYQK
jgi:DNA-binding PadR family transcriptional regulator